MWVEGVIEGTFFPIEIVDYCKTYPKWVLKSFFNLLQKEQIKKHGWLPRFMTQEGVKFLQEG